MAAAGVKVLTNKKNNVKKGLVFTSRAAKRSQQAWDLANAMFGRMLVAVGLNVGMICAVFLAVFIWKTDISGWILLKWMLFFQVLILLMPYVTTEYILNKTFDDKGEYIESKPSQFSFGKKRK